MSLTSSVSHYRWIIPTVTCNSTNAYASFWVGIDGYGSNTVEQIGTDSDCVSGKPSYYAWFEFDPHFSYNIESVTLKPGDAVSAEVNYSTTGRFTVSIKVNGAQAFSTSTKLNQAAHIWDSMTDICRSEFCTPHDVCSYVAEHKPPHGSLTSSLRVSILDYFRKSSTQDGHTRAGHGQGMFISQQQERLQMRAMKANRDRV